MDELTWRPFEPADVPALTRLVNDIESAAGGTHPLTEDQLRTYSGELRDPAGDSRSVLTADGVLVAYGWVVQPPAGGHRIDAWGGVHPDRRGRGIGRRLLAWQLERAAAQYRAAEPAPPWEVHASALADDAAATALFERSGMVSTRYWFSMDRATADPPVIEAPAGLVVAGYDPARELDVHAAHVEAFADHWGWQARAFPNWAPITVHSKGFRRELSFVAYDGAEVAGYLLSYATAEADTFDIGHVGVRRPWRRRGLASALLSRVLVAGRDAGFATATLGVDAGSPTGAVGVYEGVGFRVMSRAVTYVKKL
jgi:mycothiol synthase